MYKVLQLKVTYLICFMIFPEPIHHVNKGLVVGSGTDSVPLGFQKDKESFSSTQWDMKLK